MSNYKTILEGVSEGPWSLDSLLDRDKIATNELIRMLNGSQEEK